MNSIITYVLFDSWIQFSFPRFLLNFLTCCASSWAYSLNLSQEIVVVSHLPVSSVSLPDIQFSFLVNLFQTLCMNGKSKHEEVYINSKVFHLVRRIFQCGNALVSIAQCHSPLSEDHNPI